VANSAVAANTPEARFSVMVAAVSSRLADQPSRTACPTSPGNRRATSASPTEAILASYARQYSAVSSAVSSSAGAWRAALERRSQSSNRAVPMLPVCDRALTAG